MQERQSRKKKKESKKGFISFLIVAFVLSVIVNVVLSYGDRLETMIVTEGSEEELIKAEGFLFRDQVVINSPGDGFIYCEADEDQRVKLGEVVAYVYENELDASVNSELKMLESEIAELSGSSIKGDIYSNDTAKVEQTILSELSRVPKLGYQNQIREVEEVRKEIDHLIEGRRIITGEAEPRDSAKELEELKRKKAEIEKQHNVQRTIVHAPRTGAFTARVDGLEELLSTKNLEKISADYIKDLEKKSDGPKASTKVRAGEPIGKIVDNFSWNIAALVPEDLAEDMDVGDFIEMRFTDIGVDTVDGVVSKIIREKGKKTLIVVRSSKYVDMIYSTSRLSVEFIKHQYEGFKIPSESIRITDGKTGVYVIRNGKVKFLPVDIRYNSKEWVIVAESMKDVSTIKLYDELIVNGKNLYNDKVVR